MPKNLGHFVPLEHQLPLQPRPQVEGKRKKTFIQHRSDREGCFSPRPGKKQMAHAEEIF